MTPEAIWRALSNSPFWVGQHAVLVIFGSGAAAVLAMIGYDWGTRLQTKAGRQDEGMTVRVCAALLLGLSILSLLNGMVQMKRAQQAAQVAEIMHEAGFTVTLEMGNGIIESRIPTQMFGQEVTLVRRVLLTRSQVEALSAAATRSGSKQVSLTNR